MTFMMIANSSKAECYGKKSKWIDYHTFNVPTDKFDKDIILSFCKPLYHEIKTGWEKILNKVKTPL